jgi:hypothetical protein
LFRIDVEEDDVIKDTSLPFSSSKTSNLRVSSCETVGKWAGEMVAVTSAPTRVFLKVEPKYHAEDKGFYTIRIKLVKDYNYKISGRTRFTFHLEGLTVRPDPAQPTSSCSNTPWSDPVISDRVDNDRTPEMAAMAMPWVKQ